MSEQSDHELLLSILTGPYKGLDITINNPIVTIGRSDACDVRLEEDHAVSNEHATLEYIDGLWHLRDMKSKNGTYVIEGKTFRNVESAVVVGNGAVFLVGRTKISFGVTSEPKEQSVSEPQRDGSPHVDRDEAKLVLQIELNKDELHFHFATQKPYRAVATAMFRPSDQEYIVARLSALAEILRQGQPSSDARLRLKELGEHLRNTLIPQRIHKKLVESKSPHLLVVHSLALLELPWELLPIDEELACCRMSVGRQVLVETSSSGVQRRLSVTGDERCAVLLVSDPIGAFADAHTGCVELAQRLQQQGRARVTFIAGHRVQRADLLQKMTQADIVYFVGHALYDADHPERSGWVLRNDVITCQDIRSLDRSPRLVFANGCETARETGLGAIDQVDSAMGLAGAFILSGIDNYIGTAWPISPEEATHFAQAFFDGLFVGQSVGESLRRARVRTREELDCTTLTWASYILYGDPANQLVH